MLISRIKHSHGFTYVGLLFVIAVMGLSLALAGTLWSFAQQREKERQLIFMGNQFRQAIGLYYQKSPGTIKRYPQTLKDLIEDNRYVSIQRHLRKIYRDPMTNATEWGLVSAPEGGIMGVHSLSTGKVIKTGGFQSGNLNLWDKQRYDEWQFIYTPVKNTQ